MDQLAGNAERRWTDANFGGMPEFGHTEQMEKLEAFKNAARVLMRRADDLREVGFTGMTFPKPKDQIDAAIARLPDDAEPEAVKIIKGARWGLDLDDVTDTLRDLLHEQGIYE